MAFYTDITPVYDDLFPVPKGLLTLQKWLRGVGGVRSVVDCGCGTGSKLISFAEAGLICFGFDPDPSLVAVARQKLAAWPKAQIAEGGISDLRRLVPYPADLVMCLGDSLVQVPQAEAGAFIADVAARLAYQGRILLQILNYERLSREKVAELPPLRSGGGVSEFRRRCEWVSERKVVFHTSLRLSPDGETKTLENEVSIYPLFQEELHRMLQKAGFFDIRFFSDFSRTRFQPSSRSLICLASKGLINKE